MVKVCNDELSWTDEIGKMRESTDLLGNPIALKERIQQDGYLLLRGFHPREEVMAAREAIIGYLEKKEQKGIGPHAKEVAELPEVLNIVESPRLFDFFKSYFGEDALTFDEKWLRTVFNGGFTGLHYDNVYMGRGSDRLHTVWTPLGDLTKELGSLAVWVGDETDDLRKLKAAYGHMDVDEDHVAGWLSRDPKRFMEKYGGRWVTTDVQAGDVIVITMFTMHCSTVNETDDLRLSCDIRYQPASDAVDERWYGNDRKGHYGRAQQSAAEFLAEKGIVV
jgi:hypothetical protein